MSVTFTVNHVVPATFGPGASKLVGEKMKELGATIVFVVFDKGIEKTGLTTAIIESVEKAGLKAVPYNEVELEPTCASIDKAAAVAKAAGVDGIVGFGGGSSMDTAKGLSIVLSNGGQMYDWMFKPNKKKYPLICIPTTAGTSSEVAPNCAVTDDRTGDKLAAPHKADLALVDPELTVGCPPFISACCGFDMISHTVESYTNPNMEHWLSDDMNERIIEIMYKWLPVAVNDGKNMEARTMVSYACLNTGYAFGDKGTHLGHALSDTIHLYEPGISHGLGCAFSVPIVIRYYATRKPEKIRKLGEVAGMQLPESFSDQEAGDYVASAFRRLLRVCGIQNFKAYCGAESMEKVIKELPNNFRFKNIKNPMDFAFVEELIRYEYDHE